MRPFLAMIFPVGGHVDNSLPLPGMPVDPGYGVEAPAYPDQGLPGRPPRPSHPIARPPLPGRPVDPGYGVDQGGSVDNSLPELPPEVQPPIYLPVPPGSPPTIWPSPGSPQHPIVMPPPGVWPMPKPAPGYVVVWVPRYGVAYVKLGASVANPIAPGGPTAQPKA